MTLLTIGCWFDLSMHPATGRVGTKCYVPNRGCEMDVRRTKVQFDLGQVIFPYYRCERNRISLTAIFITKVWYTFAVFIPGTVAPPAPPAASSAHYRGIWHHNSNDSHHFMLVTTTTSVITSHFSRLTPYPPPPPLLYVLRSNLLTPTSNVFVFWYVLESTRPIQFFCDSCGFGHDTCLLFCQLVSIYIYYIALYIVFILLRIRQVHTIAMPTILLWGV